MKYYKFVSDHTSVPYFLDGSIKFTPISELNDPSELTSNIIKEDVEQSLNRLRKNGYRESDLQYLKQQGHLLQRLAPEFQAARVPQTVVQATTLIRSRFYDNLPLLEQLLAETATQISSKVGLFCVSKRFDSLPMWAHYATSASGLVVVFEGLDDVFQGDDTGVLKKPIDVRYNREESGVTFEPSSHEALFFEKFQDWSYEQEVRVVMPLDECKVVRVKENNLYLYKIPPTHISELIIGWNMKDDSIEKIYKSVQNSSSSIQISRADFRKGEIIKTNLNF